MKERKNRDRKEKDKINGKQKQTSGTWTTYVQNLRRYNPE